ncbi:hypothetical protein Hanom_Chr02g00167531 [Helianthus anomalus]
MFVHLTKRMRFLVCVLSFIKRTNTNEHPAERFTNCSLNVWFVCSPTKHGCSLVGDIINASGNTARVPRGLCGNWPRIIPLIIGKQNAAVFPDPV